MTKSKLLFFILGILITKILVAQDFERQILSSTDDAEEKHDGTNVTTSSSDLELVYDSWNDQGLQIIGLRFDNITVPANATITNAYIQFTADGDYSGDITLVIKGEDRANPAPYEDTFRNISNRKKTDSSVTWTSIPNWSDDQSGIGQRTPDLSEIVLEIMNSNGWKSGNAMAFVIEGSGSSSQKRRAFSFDENPVKAPKLIIDYESNSAVDLALVNCIRPTTTDYPNAQAEVLVEVTSFGNQTVDDYTLSYSIDGIVVATEQINTPISLGESIIYTFDEKINLSTTGEYDLMVELSVANDAELSNNRLSKKITIVDEVDPLFFNQGSAWRYWDKSTNPGSMWNDKDYDAANWLVGSGHFGFGEGDEQTQLSNGLISYYFRKKVFVSDINQLEEVYLNILHDDAAIVYINGQEVVRSELMPLGTVTHSTAARQRANHVTENSFYTYKIESEYFVNGENTIAISIRNEEASDEDLSFNAFIRPQFNYDQDGPYVSYLGDSILVEEVTPNGLISKKYVSKAEIELTCILPHMNTSFSFKLKPEIKIEPSVFEDRPSKFLAISDFDGHIEGLTMVLKGEGIIDDQFNWTYGDGHLIISGDLFDRGFHITECMWLLYKLEQEAEAQGGKLHLIIGNHEIFNLTDDWRYVEVKYFNNAHLMGKRMAELYGPYTELGQWLRSKNIIEKIGDHAFLHGGLSPELAAFNPSLDEINEYGRREMNGMACPNATCVLVNSSEGVYWYRGMVREDLTQEQVEDILDVFDIDRVILGHTKANTIRSLYNGRVIAIDMYHVNNFEDGFMEALQFELGCFYLFHTDGTTQDYTLLNDCDDLNSNVIEMNKEGGLQVYPNPTSELLNIRLPKELSGNCQYTIHDIKGRLVSSGTIDKAFTTIEVGMFTSGKYIVTLRGLDKIIKGSFILK